MKEEQRKPTQRNKLFLMNKLFLKLFTILLFGICFNTTPTKASHMMGSDITWKCLGGDTFLFTVTVYRDCNGIPLSAGPFEISSSCGTKTVSTTMGPGLDITPVCKKSCTRCKSLGCSFPFGIEQYQQTAKVILDPKCCKYNIGWQQCCRNGAITTITPGNFYVEVEMNRCQKPCDNSPYFTNPPMAIICTNQCFVFNQGVNDIDIDNNGQADSLVYKLTTPLDSKGSPVSYTGSYTYKEPVKYYGAFGKPNLPWDPPKCQGFHLDTFTGDLMFKATKTDVTVLSIAVEEWRKDSAGIPRLIGIVRRDVQISIIDCPDNKIPVVSGINGTANTTMNFCVDQLKCFTVNTYDLNLPDTVSMNWNKSIPGATFTVEKGKKHPKGTFCWKPTQSQYRTFPYFFVVNAQDDACPVNGRTTKTFKLYVKPKPEANYSATVDQCGYVTFKAVNSGKVPIVKYTWSGDAGLFILNSSTAKKYYKDPGTYGYTLTLESVDGCQYSYTDSVKIPPHVDIDLPKDTVVCYGTTLTLVGVPKRGVAPFTYSWAKNSSTVNSLTVTITKDTMFTEYIQDKTGCIGMDSIIIKSKAYPKPNLGKDRRKCYNDTMILDPRITEKNSKFKWYNAKYPATIINTLPTLEVRDSGKYYVVVTDSVGCIGTDTMNAYFNPMLEVIPDFKWACQGDSVTIDGGKAGPGTKWTWKNVIYPTNPAMNFTTTTSILKFKPVVANYIFQVRATQTINGITCFDEDTITVQVAQKPTVSVGKIPNQCINNPPQYLGDFGSPLGGTFSCTDAGLPFNPVNFNYFNPSVGSGTYNLRYDYTDPQTGCKNFSTGTITVNLLPNVIAGPDDYRCTDDGIKVLSGSPAGGTWTENGTVIASNFFDPVAAGPGPHMLIYTFKDKNTTCSGSDTMIMFVYQTPKLKLTTPPALCENDQPLDLTLYANLKKSKGWFMTNGPTTAVEDSTYFNPKTAKAGVHWVRYNYDLGLDPSGKPKCPVFDSIPITVNPMPVVSVSTIDSQNTYCISHGYVELIYSATPSGGKGTWTAKPYLVGGKYFVPSLAKAGLKTLTFKYVDPNGCEVITNLDITVVDSPHVEITSSNVVCEGKTFILSCKTSGSATGVLWSRQDFPTDPNKTIKDNTALQTIFTPEAGLKTVWMRVTTLGNSYCAPSTDSILLYISPLPAPDFDGNPLSGCSPLFVKFRDKSDQNVAPISKYEWDFGDGSKSTQQNPSHVYTTPGTYTVKLKVISVRGCDSELTKVDYINVYPSPIADFIAKPTFTSISLPTIHFKDQSQGSVQDYLWNFGDRNNPTGGTSTLKDPEYSYSDTGLYTVKLIVKSPNGCTDTLIKPNYIDIRPEITVFIPNVFTPNDFGPKKNEAFTVIASNFTDFHLSMYSRWGELLYETTDITKGWDGTYKGKECQEGVYVYLVEISSITGKKYKFNGSATLLR